MKKYDVEIDSVSETDWNIAIRQFADSTVYQTWAYGKAHSAMLSHIVIRDGDGIASAAQTRIYRVPGLKYGIAYLHWGPLWRKINGENQIEAFAAMADALSREYGVRRGLHLQTLPACYRDEPIAQVVRGAFERAGYVYSEGEHNLLRIDLSKSAVELRKGFLQKWRNQLNAAERNNLQIFEGYDDELIVHFSGLYKEMCVRKRFAKPNSIDHFVKIFKAIPRELKPRIVLCQHDGSFVGGGVFSVQGDTGIYLYGATNEAGMKYKASYLIQWKIIEWLKENGFSRYDLSGFNAEKVPGTYHFKAGVCGKNGSETALLGEFSFCVNSVSNMIASYLARIRRRKNQRVSPITPATDARTGTDSESG